MTNWVKIHALEAEERLWKAKESSRRRELIHWKITGKRAHEWLTVHERNHEHANAEKNKKEIEQVRPHIKKWTVLLTEAEHHTHGLRNEIAKLKPKQQLWGAGGWVAPGMPWRMQRCDQGQDLEIPLYHAVVAPGDGSCIGYASDGPFPSGFGSPYALVHITTGRFAGNNWYLGHANEPIIKPGQSFKAGQPLARLNHSLNSGWGWIEIGHLPYGGMSEGFRWHSLFTSGVWR